MVIEVETKACDVCGKTGEVRDGKTCELGGGSLRYLCQRRLLARTSEVLHSLLHPVDMKCLTPVSVWEVVQPQ